MNGNNNRIIPSTQQIPVQLIAVPPAEAISLGWPPGALQMSLCAFIATAAMQGLLAGRVNGPAQTEGTDYAQRMIEAAVNAADLLIAELAKRKSDKVTD